MSKIISTLFEDTKFTPESIEIQNRFKEKFIELEIFVHKNILCSRSKDIAMMKLEEAYMWVGKGIINDQIEKENKTSFKKDSEMIQHESYYDEKAKVWVKPLSYTCGKIDKGFSINLPPNLKINDKINEDDKKRPMLESIEKFKKLRFIEMERLFLYYGHACYHAKIGECFSKLLKESLEKVEKDMEL